MQPSLLGGNYAVYQCILKVVETTETIKEKSLLRELEDENVQCHRIVIEQSNKLFDSSSKIREAVLRQAYNLNLLIKYYPESIPYPQNCIFSAITEEYRRASVPEAAMKTIYKAFEDPEYDIYKSHVYNTAKRKLKTQEEIDTQAQGEKYSVDTQIWSAIHLLETNPDHPKVKTFNEKVAKMQSRLETRQRKEKEEQDMITIPKPDWIDPELDGHDSLTYRAALAYTEAWKNITTRIWQYPPKQENDEYYARGIETMHALVVPGTDLKYVRDTLSYMEINLEMHTQSIHSSMSKSKLLTPSGKYRKMTREQIADISPQMLLLAIHIIENLPGYVAFCLYLLREQKPYSGDFHLARHDKLSESAFGKGSFVD